MRDREASGDTLTIRNRLAYSVFNGADLLVKNVVGKYLLFFYTTTLGVSPGWIAVGQPLVKLLDVVTDPLVGRWSDRTRTRMGRRRPWILVGSIALGIIFPLAWAPRYVMFWTSTPTLWSIFVYFLVFKFLYYVTHTLCVVPYYALGAELSSDYDERTRIVAWRHMIGLPAVILATVPYIIATNPRLFSSVELGIPIVMGGVGLLVIVTGLITSLGTRERIQKQQAPLIPMGKSLKITLGNRPFLFLTGSIFFFGVGQYFATSFAPYLITYIIYEGDKAKFSTLLFQATTLGVIAGMALNVVVRKLAVRFDKSKVFIVFMAIGLAAPLATLIAFDPERPYLYFIFHACALPFAHTAVEILPLSIVADICDVDALKCGQRREGMFVGVYNAAFKTGYLLSPAIAMTCLSLTGFDGTLSQQTQETQGLLRLYLFVGTAITFGLAFLLSLGVRLRREDVERTQVMLSSAQDEDA